MQITGEELHPRVERSLAVELEWLLCGARHDPNSATPSCLAELITIDPAIQAAVRNFWGDGDRHSPELLVLAQQGGVLFETDIDVLLSAIANRQEDPGDLTLITESETERALALARLDALRRSSTLRSRYVELLRTLWGAAEEEYESRGRKAAGKAVERYRERLQSGASWRELVGNPFADPFLDGLLDRMAPNPPVVLVPTYFFGKLLAVDLPGLLVIGGPATTPSAPAADHSALARRLRAIGHPTRLNILASLAQRSASVGELAEDFALAQPTVTNHVKLLREAGLVRSEREGTRLRLHVDDDALSALLGQVGNLTQLPEGADHGR